MPFDADDEARQPDGGIAPAEGKAQAQREGQDDEADDEGRPEDGGGDEEDFEEPGAQGVLQAASLSQWLTAVSTLG